MGGELYNIPAGLTVHCIECSKTLEEGDICYIAEDSSSILCLDCLSKRQNRERRRTVGPTEYKDEPQRQAHGRRASWMSYD